MVNAITVPFQSVGVNQPVLYSTDRICTGCSTRHTPGSGRVTLTKPGIYNVFFTGTLSTATAGPIILNLSMDGEAVPAAQINITAAVSTLYEGTIVMPVRVYCPGGSSISVVNASADVVNVQNANIVVERVG